MRLSAFVAASLSALVLVPQAAADDPNGFRAAVSFWAMRHAFYDHDARLYRTAEGNERAASAWQYSQALAATIAMTAVPRRGKLYVQDATEGVSGLSPYLRADGAYAAGRGPSGPVYYDDNEWIALELVRWYHLHTAGRALTRAERLFRIVTKAWDSNPAHVCPGGVFWTTVAGNEDRNAVTTATGALLGLRLYEATRDKTVLAWSRQMLAWVSNCLLAPDGLFWDHLAPDGTRDESEWSYNQGTAIGANVLLYRLTGDDAALTRAERLADTSLAYFDLTPDGKEPPYFLAIFFQNLLDLAAMTGNANYRAAAQQYADAAWQTVRDPKTCLFRFHPSQPVQLLEQAAMVQIYAALAVTST